jgi:hypothetical protein
MRLKNRIVFSMLGTVFFSLSAFSQDDHCLTCNFPLAPEASKPGSAKACDDLFGAACMNTSGNLKQEGSSKQLSQEMAKMVHEARNKTAQDMGFKNIDEALKAKLKEAGLLVKEPVDPAAWGKLVGDGEDADWIENAATKLYASADECGKDLAELQKMEIYKIDDAKTMNETISKYDVFNTKYRELSIKLFSRDLPDFISVNIGIKCHQLDMKPELLKNPENADIVKACGNMTQIRRKAVELFREEGTGGYQQKAEAFVRENFLPELNYIPMYSATPAGGAPSAPMKEPTESEKLKALLQVKSSSIHSTCMNYNSVAEKVGAAVSEELLVKVAKSKPTVEALVDSVYTRDKEKMANAIFTTARSDIQDLANAFVKDPQKKGLILDEYDSMQLHWMQKPDAAAYIKDESGRPILDQSKRMSSPGDSVGTAFFDPKLSFFRTFNAFYLPEISFGKQRSAERITLMPAALALLEKNPFAFLSVAAHEIGHKIGPEVSRINGYELRSEYKDLIECYKDGKSIRLQDNQGDETIADYISSEVLARQIQRLPVEKREPALLSAVGAYCSFSDRTQVQGIFMCKENHPEQSLRVSGIFGANPSIRKILRCEKDSPQFRTCGLKTSILSVVEPHTSSQAHPAKGTK